MIRNAGGRATDDAIRSLVISHKLLGTRTWLVVHHTNCGMELFTDQVMGELLEDDLGTASFDGSSWSNPHHRGGHAAGHFIKWHTIADQESSVVRDVRRVREHPLVPGEIPIFGFIYDVRTGKSERSRCGQRGRATPLSGYESALPDAGGSDDPQIANEVPQPQDELAFGFLTLK